MNAPELCGKEVDIGVFVDSDHAGNKFISHTWKWLIDICENILV